MMLLRLFDIKILYGMLPPMVERRTTMVGERPTVTVVVVVLFGL